LASVIRQWWRDSEQVKAAALSVNLERLRAATLFMLLINVVHMWVFHGDMGSASAIWKEWGQRVFWVHALMLVAMALIALWVHRHRHDPAPHRITTALPVLTSALTLLFGVGVTLVDQAVTPNISAYLNTCAGIAIIFLLRPIHALALFGVAGLLMYWGLRTQSLDTAVVMNNQSNAITASLLAVMVSAMLWRRFTQTELLQRELTATNALLRQQQAELERLAIKDPLTGLINRREFERRAQLELARAQRDGLPVAVVMADLDHFKRVNDSLGHQAGDAVLAHAAHLMATGVRTTDHVCRYGGEEFVLLLPNTTGASATQLADKLRLAQATQPARWQGEPITVTASWGVAATTAGQPVSLDELVRCADLALYRAKAMGRNRVALADASPP
jgi:diguanylate cyclase (GGDEF)-like protein